MGHRLRTDETGVSPVIGTILMVAVTVIIAAVIGSSALGIADDVSETPPKAQFDVELVEEETTISNNWEINDFNTISVEHVGGESVDPDNIEIQVDGNKAYTIHRDEDPSTNDAPSGTYWGARGDNSDKYPDAVPIQEYFESDETLSAGSNIPILASDVDGLNVEQPNMYYKNTDIQIRERDEANYAPEEVGITEGAEVTIVWNAGSSSQVLVKETV